jgi:hypothetical protein
MEVKECENVSCGSNHPLCFGCERTWRSKMPLQDGVRIMTCPTCRQPETYRTIASLQRETQTKTLTHLAQAADDLVVETRRFVRTSETYFIERAAARVREIASSAVARAPTSAVARAALPSTREPDIDARPRARCASGRCQSTSRTGRAMTYLKCNVCNIVFCCRACRECVSCAV